MPHHFWLNALVVVIVCTIGIVALFRYSKSNDPDEEEKERKNKGKVISYVDNFGRLHYEDEKTERMIR